MIEWFDNDENKPSNEECINAEEEYSRFLGICASCYFSNDDKINVCNHPARRNFPTKPRKKKCKYYREWTPDLEIGGT